MNRSVNLKFRPALIPTLCTLVLVPVLASLGFWQLDRAREKAEILQHYEDRLAKPQISIGEKREDPRTLEYRRLRATGTWHDEHQFFVDNRILNHRAGFHVVTPLLLKGNNTAILVNRGWIPADPDRSILPTVEPLEGTATATGIAVIPYEVEFLLETEPPIGEQWPVVWQVLDLVRFQNAVPYQIYGVVVRLDELHPDGFARQWSRPEDQWIFRHKAYAFQWFALATTLLVIYIALTIRRSRQSTSD